jgi:hypothetical protein
MVGYCMLIYASTQGAPSRPIATPRSWIPANAASYQQAARELEESP